MIWRSLAALVVALGVAAAMPQDLGGHIDEAFGGGGGGSYQDQNAGGSFPDPNAGGFNDQPAAAGSQPAGDCECVPYYQCANGTIIKNGVGLIDIRIHDGPCDSYLDVCCRPPDRIEVPNRGTATDGTGSNAGDEGYTGGGQGGSHGGGQGGYDQGTGGGQGGYDQGTGGGQGGYDQGTGGGQGGSQGGGHDGGQDGGHDGGHGGGQDGGHGGGQDGGHDGGHGGGQDGGHDGGHGGGQDGGHSGGQDGGHHGGGHPVVCGQRNPDGVGFRIVGDTDGESQFGEFPWMTAILHEEAVGDGNDEKLNVYKCGGSLIHPQVVLTAAHCVHETPTGLKVRVGEWDTQTRSELLPHQDRNVEKVLIHPDFHHDSLYNDFALLMLDSPVRLAENVQPVCLPPPGTAADHGPCAVSGWGKDVFGKEGRYQVILKKVEVPPVARAECIERLRKTRLGKYFQLHESFICAGGEPGADTCKGDGGGPLVCPIAGHPKTYQQMGIVAWGIGCGEAIPAVYADVSYARAWIDNQMGELGIRDLTYVSH